MSDQSSPTPPPPEVLTVEQLAELLQMPRSSAYAAIVRGEIPGVRRIGKHMRIHRATVVAWLSGEGRVVRGRRRSA